MSSRRAPPSTGEPRRRSFVPGPLRTIAGLIAHLARRQRFFLVPLVVVLLAASALLIITGGLGVVAPFFYTLF